MSVTRETPEGVYGESNPQDLCDMAKANHGLNLGPRGPTQALRLNHAYAEPVEHKGRRFCPRATPRRRYIQPYGYLPATGRRAMSPHKGQKRDA